MCDNFKKTTFITVPVPYMPDSGKPIGEGECKAVRLKLNNFNRNAVTQVRTNAVFYIYYGDGQSQENELYAGSNTTPSVGGWSPLIYCCNLNEVFVRQGIDANATYNVQVQIYQ